jgi:monoamine oxidase
MRWAKCVAQLKAIKMYTNFGREVWREQSTWKVCVNGIIIWKLTLKKFSESVSTKLIQTGKYDEISNMSENKNIVVKC